MKISIKNLEFIYIFCLIYGYPTLCEELDNNNVIDTEILNEDYVNENGHKIVKKSVELDSKMKNTDVELQEPCRLSLPVLDTAIVNELSEPYEENVLETVNLSPSNLQYIPYEEIPYDYNPDYLDDFRFVSYIIPEEYMSRFPPVRSLPPVYTTKIYETIPNDVTEDEDSFNFVPNVRAVRSEEEDLLAKLEKDSFIPNILPVMPWPYMREAVSYEPTQNDQYIAMYPVDSVSDCAIPYLLTCNPQVNSGSLVYNNPSEYTSSSYKNVDY